MQITLPRPPRASSQPRNTIRFELPRPAELRRLRLWQTVILTGNQQLDSLRMRQLWRKLEHLQQFPNSTTGVTVRFGPQARYGRVVDVLDCVHQWNVQKYYLDIHSPVLTLYAFTDARQQPASRTITPYNDVTGTSVTPAPPTSITARWLQQVGAPLQQPAWSTALLACLGVAVIGAACYVLRELS